MNDQNFYFFDKRRRAIINLKKKIEIIISMIMILKIRFISIFANNSTKNSIIRFHN